MLVTSGLGPKVWTSCKKLQLPMRWVVVVVVVVALGTKWKLGWARM